MKDNYSENIATQIKKFLVTTKHNYTFDDGKFIFAMVMTGKIKASLYEIVVGEKDFVVYAYPLVELDATDKELINRLTEFVCRANCGIKNGCFEIDMRDGVLRYKIFTDCSSIFPSQRNIASAVVGAGTMLEFLSEGVWAILYKQEYAKEAIELCVEKFLDDTEKTAKH